MVMGKVYVVSSGMYSDYSIDEIFTTRRKAEEYMLFIPDRDYNEIEEIETDPPAVDLLKRGYSLWFVTMWGNGHVDNIDKTLTRYRPHYEQEQDKLLATVWAKSEKHAIKIVNEKRIQMIANGEWK